MQERRNSIANALKLRLSCTNPSICRAIFQRGGDHDVHLAVDHVQAKKDAEVGGTHNSHHRPQGPPFLTWASYQIRKIAGCACTGNTGNVFLATAG